MPSTTKLSTETLRHVGLALSEAQGIKLRHAGKNQADQLYSAEGKTYRLRTTNDRCLTVGASSPDPNNAMLDFEGCDFLIITMPVVRRSLDAVEAFIIPAGLVKETLCHCHGNWLKREDKYTAGNNQTYSIWFDDRGWEASNFGVKWREYRIPFTLRITADA
jgi:hypothetical protein